MCNNNNKSSNSYRISSRFDGITLKFIHVHKKICDPSITKDDYRTTGYKKRPSLNQLPEKPS